MERRKLGVTGLETSVLGFGAGHIGGAEITGDEATRLVRTAVDLGVTLFDTARGYGLSEERLGHALREVRDQVVLSTKGGYGIEGVPDWTGETITRGVDEALNKLQTDRLDIFHLHSCPGDVLARDDIQRALENAKTSGKIKVAAYSGENEDLARAIATGAFGSVQLSVNVCDRNALENPAAVPEAVKREMGVIGKRPLANAPWRHAKRPAGEYVETYWDRFRAMRLDKWQGDWGERALRFAAWAPGVTSVIVGTRSLAHLRSATDAIRRGRLVEDERYALKDEWDRHGKSWRGEV